MNGPDRKLWLERLGADVDNLRAVFELGAVSPATALSMAATLGDFWEARGEYTEASAHLDAALAASPEPSRARADALQAAGLVGLLQGDRQAAARYTDEALLLSRNLGDAEDEALCLQQLGQIATQANDLGAAERFVTDALAIAVEHDYPQIQALCQWRLGLLAVRNEAFDAAKTRFEAGLDISSRLGDSASVATAQLMLGNIALREGRLDEARTRLRESLDFHRQSGSSRSLAHVLESLAAAALLQGQTERAQRLAGAADGLRQRIGLATSNREQHDFGSLPLDSLRGDSDSNQAWLVGAAMSRDEAIGYALDEFERTLATSG